MNWIDLFIIVIFGYNIIIGLCNGLLKSLFGIGAFLGAIIFAPTFQEQITNLLKNHFSAHIELTKMVSLGFSWLAVYIILNFTFNVLLMRKIERTTLKFFDRLLGMSFGIFTSIIIVITPMLIIEAIPIIKKIPEIEKTINKSALYYTFKPITKPVQKTFDKLLEEQRKELMEKIKQKKVEIKIN